MTTHTFVATFHNNSKMFSGNDYDKVSQDAWNYLDSFSGEVWRTGNLDLEVHVIYNGVKHTVQWELAGNMSEIYPSVFSGLLDRW